MKSPTLDLMQYDLSSTIFGQCALDDKHKLNLQTVIRNFIKYKWHMQLIKWLNHDVLFAACFHITTYYITTYVSTFQIQDFFERYCSDRYSTFIINSFMRNTY